MRSRSPHLRSAVPRAPAPPTRRIAVGLAGAALLLLATGCPTKGSQAPGAQSVERQSDSEYDLARDLFDKGNPRAALDHARKAITLNEDNDKAQYFIAVIQLSFCSTNKGLDAVDCRLPEAEKATRAALKANPDFRDAKNLLGSILVNEKRYKDAITVLEPLTKDPAYVHPYFAWGNLGQAQLGDGQVDAAILSLKNAVAEPRFCVGHYNLGLAYEKKGDLASAEASFTSAVSADPQCESLQDAWWGALPDPEAARQRRVEEGLREVPRDLRRNGDRKTLRSDARGRHEHRHPASHANANEDALSMDTVGTTLQRQRETKRMSLAEVSRVTRIPLTTLEAIEQDHFDDLPGEVFVKGFLKSYAATVGPRPGRRGGPLCLEPPCLRRRSQPAAGRLARPGRA